MRMPNQELIARSAIWLILLIFPVAVLCSTPSDYRTRIEAANKDVATMIAIVLTLISRT